jgi:histo-blood group ABO system transferase
MKNFRNLAIILTLLTQSVYSENVGLLIMATGKYVIFVEPLIQSAEKHFCENHHVTYFVFTDGVIPQADNIVQVFQKRIGWPYDTLKRYHVYFSHRNLFEDQDYLFACDADMLFVDDVGDEILGERVATQHPGFVGMRGSYETNPESTACIKAFEGEQYFAGGFYGGTTEEMLKIFATNINNIDDDLERGLIAVWHDESHWNRYCIDNKPTVILSPSYCYPESWDMPYPRKLLALDKDHSEFQTK